MARRGDRGEGPVNYLAIVLLVAAVAATATLVALPNQVTGSITAAVCRVIGKECGGQDASANPSGPPGPGEGTTSPPAGPSPSPDGQSPEDRELLDALAAYNTAGQDATAADNEWNAFNLLDELAKLGMDFLFGDIKACIDKPNVSDCLWAIVGIIPWGKVGKFIKMIPGLARLADRFMDLRRRLDKARDARQNAQRRLDRIIETCTDKRRTGNSFVPGTPVLLADGRSKPIERISAGDLVWATDPATGASGVRPVSAPITGSGRKHLVELVVDPDGAPGGPAATVTATANHPFWVAGSRGGWFGAGELLPGDRLLTPSGGAALVLHARHRLAPRQRVHNLSVAGLHTYYVLTGRTPVLVHNCDLTEVDSDGSQAANRAALRIWGRDGFSGVYDPVRDRFVMRLSGGPNAVVSTFGGHGDINDEIFGRSWNTVGFVAVLGDDGVVQVRWNSRSVNGRNFGERAAPVEHREAILDAIRRATGLRVRG